MKLSHVLASLALTTLAATAPALAAPKGMAASGAASGAASVAPLAAGDQQFVAKTAQGSNYELMVSELGVSRAVDPMVREYAQALVLDHATYNVGLLNLANRYGVRAAVVAEASDLKRLGALEAQSGPAFDAAFLAEEKRINDQDIADETRELSATSNDELRTYVTELQNGDRFHARLAQTMMGGAGAIKSQ